MQAGGRWQVASKKQTPPEGGGLGKGAKGGRDGGRQHAELLNLILG